jgi:hypothetical protein
MMRCRSLTSRTSTRRVDDELEEAMLTAPDVAREVSVSRRAEARESELVSAARLARRQQRLERRIERLNSRLAAHR